MDENAHGVDFHSTAEDVTGAKTSEKSLKVAWDKACQEINEIDGDAENWKIQTLPLARIKKIMKTEEFVMQELEKDRLERDGHARDDKPGIKFMISAEAPLLMSKACELFIREISVRAWQHTERNRRRTLQRQDVHAAVGECDDFDFLIDLVPRVITTTNSRQTEANMTHQQALTEPQHAAFGMPQLPLAFGAVQNADTGGSAMIPSGPYQGTVTGNDLPMQDQLQQAQFYSLFQQMAGLPMDGVPIDSAVFGQQMVTAGLTGDIQSQHQTPLQQPSRQVQQWTDTFE